MVYIPQEVFDAYNSFADDFINSNFGLNCTLIYPEQKIQCANCIWDNISNKSTNIYLAGGPMPFSFGICPWCNGLGTRSVAQTEGIKMRVYFSRRDWVKVPAPVNIPDGMVQSIGFLTDLPKIKQSQTVQFNSDQAGYINYNYVLAGEPVTHGFKQNRYFIAYWNRD